MRLNVKGRTFKNVQVVVSYAEATKADVKFVGYLEHDFTAYYEVGGRLCTEEVHGNNGIYKDDENFSNRYFVYRY